jgi:hypothetical protein
MPTKAVLEQRLETRTRERDAAREDSVSRCTLRHLSSSLLDRIQERRNELEQEIGILETTLGRLEDAYSAADKADDLVIELDNE